MTPTIYALVRNYLTCQNICERKARNSSNFGSQPFVNYKKISVGVYNEIIVEGQKKFLKLKSLVKVKNQILIVHKLFSMKWLKFVSALLRTDSEYRAEGTRVCSVYMNVLLVLYSLPNQQKECHSDCS